MKDIKILYVEDFEVIQEMYVDALKMQGFNVDVASDGKEADLLVKDNDYSLILLDLLLPEMSGVEFLKKYRNDGGKAKVIVLTDFDDPKTTEQIKELNVDGYWMKVENTPHALADRVKKVLKQQ